MSRKINNTTKSNANATMNQQSDAPKDIDFDSITTAEFADILRTANNDNAKQLFNSINVKFLNVSNEMAELNNTRTHYINLLKTFYTVPNIKSLHNANFTENTGENNNCDVQNGEHDEEPNEEQDEEQYDDELKTEEPKSEVCASADDLDGDEQASIPTNKASNTAKTTENVKIAKTAKKNSNDEHKIIKNAGQKMVKNTKTSTREGEINEKETAKPQAKTVKNVKKINVHNNATGNNMDTKDSNKKQVKTTNVKKVAKKVDEIDEVDCDADADDADDVDEVDEVDDIECADTKKKQIKTTKKIAKKINTNNDVSSRVNEKEDKPTKKIVKKVVKKSVKKV